MLDFLERLKKEVLVASGVLGTNLALRGYDQTENAGWWAINHPDIYRGLIKDWIDAGCDYVSSGTGSTNRLRLKIFNLEDKTREINYKMTQIVREVVPSNCYLAFTLHASGLFLPPMGSATPNEVYECFSEQVSIAEDIGVDLFEVMASDIEQLEIIMKAVKDKSKLPVVGQIHSFSPSPKGFRTMVGVDPATGASKLAEFGADVVGAICGSIDYKNTTAVMTEMGAACDKPLFPKPNAGIPRLINDETVYPATPEQMAEEVPNWIKARARLIGGCCGTTPEHIAKVAAVVK